MTGCRKCWAIFILFFPFCFFLGGGEDVWKLVRNYLEVIENISSIALKIGLCDLFPVLLECNTNAHAQKRFTHKHAQGMRDSGLQKPQEHGSAALKILLKLQKKKLASEEEVFLVNIWKLLTNQWPFNSGIIIMKMNRKPLISSNVEPPVVRTLRNTLVMGASLYLQNWGYWQTAHFILGQQK